MKHFLLLIVLAIIVSSCESASKLKIESKTKVDTTIVGISTKVYHQDNGDVNIVEIDTLVITKLTIK